MSATKERARFLPGLNAEVSARKTDECPSSITWSPRTSDQLYTQLAATQYVEAFGSYVEK